MKKHTFIYKLKREAQQKQRDTNHWIFPPKQKGGEKMGIDRESLQKRTHLQQNEQQN